MVMAMLYESINRDVKCKKEPYEPKQLNVPNHKLKCLNPKCEENRRGNGSYCSPECALIHKQIKKQQFKNKQ